MIEDLIYKKSKFLPLSQVEYYEAVDYLLKHGVDKTITKFFLSLDSFSMTKKEVLYLSLALRDSGRIIKYNQFVFEKHSTGGVADGSSLILIPLIASMGYKMIKTTGRSMVYTNGSADRFKSIPNFTTKLTDEEIKNVLDETNACVLSHNGDICPADSLLYDLREKYNLSSNLNLIASSIACKKLASGAKMVLVDIKYGHASLVENYKQAKKLASILKYVFKQNHVKCVIVITNTSQQIGKGIGNTIEVQEAIDVLKGEKSRLRDIASLFAYEMVTSVNKRISKNDTKEIISALIDSGEVYRKFLLILKSQGGDTSTIEQNKLFQPKHSIDFASTKTGYVSFINSVVLGEIVRRLSKETNDNNIAIKVNVSVGDYVHVGDTLVTFYYHSKKDLVRFQKHILDCIHLTDLKIKKVNIVKRIMR